MAASPALASAGAPAGLAGGATVYGLFATRAGQQPDAIAVEMGATRWTYRQLHHYVDVAAGKLRAAGLVRGERVAVLSENCLEYLVIQLASARIGSIVACQNWRSTEAELRHCLALVTPRLLIASARYADLAARLAAGNIPLLPMTDFGAVDDAARVDTVPPEAQPEDGLILLYTSGTTGLPKAALISHRAEIARMGALRLDLGLQQGDNYLAWSPMFHMGGTEHSLATLMSGGRVIVTDGFDLDAMVAALVEHQLGWLLLVPATIEPLLARIEAEGIRAKGVRVVGCMADLVPVAIIAGITRALNAPFLNSFGSTETGLPPLSADLIAVGVEPQTMVKRLSNMAEFRLVDADGNPAAPGAVGEGAMRGPTLFSGYWAADEANAKAFRDGWYLMGDLFRPVDGGGYDFAGRSKYLIKSGGENVYPAEIERVLLADPRIADAVAVRKPDDRWGEVPVAFIARADPTLTEADCVALCDDQLARYKRPRMFIFIDFDAMPRSTSGKIMREALESQLVDSDASRADLPEPERG